MAFASRTVLKCKPQVRRVHAAQASHLEYVRKNTVNAAAFNQV